MAREKIPHAYLFTGIPGIGKTSTAMALAMALNCESRVEGDSCGHCASCRQMMGGNFPDFLSITRPPDKKNILIEQIRELNRQLGFAQVSGGYRVCLIHQADIMTREAANCFLKTLEEPPPGNIFILNTPEPRDLLPTIVSRCQRVPFQPLPVGDMTNWLVNNKDQNRETAELLARISTGSLGLALRMCEGDFLDKRQEWIERLTRLPGLSREEGFEMAVKCGNEAKKIGADRSEEIDIGEVDILDVWESWYRDLILARSGGQTKMFMNMDFSHKLKNLAGTFKIDNLADSLLVIDQAQRDLRRNRNTKIVMEYCVLRLYRLARARGAQAAGVGF